MLNAQLLRSERVAGSWHGPLFRARELSTDSIQLSQKVATVVHIGDV